MVNIYCFIGETRTLISLDTLIFLEEKQNRKKLLRRRPHEKYRKKLAYVYIQMA